MRNHAQQIAVAIVESEDRFLIGQRPAGVPLAGYWEFPGGKMGPGELPEEAAVRECLEETGLVVEAASKLPPQLCEYDYGRISLHFVQCRVLKGGSSPRPPFRWVARAELANYRFPEGNQEMLKLLAESSS